MTDNVREVTASVVPLFAPEYTQSEKIARRMLSRWSTAGNSPLVRLSDVREPYDLVYECANKMVNSNDHYGQYKLFLTELEFVMLCYRVIRAVEAKDIEQQKALATQLCISALCDSLKIQEPPGSFTTPGTRLIPTKMKLTPPKSGKMFMVYAGAAPCEHMYYLSYMFPDIVWILVDPNQFNLLVTPKTDTVNNTSYRQYDCPTIAHLVCKAGLPIYHGRNLGGIGRDGATAAELKAKDWVSFITSPKNSDIRIFLAETFMDSTTAGALKDLNKHGNVGYISDIRTNHNPKLTGRMLDIDDDSDSPLNWDITYNSGIDMTAIHILKPFMYMLKFRQLFLDNYSWSLKPANVSDFEHDLMDEIKKVGADFAGAYNKRKQIALSGDIYIQCFPGKSSSETRLISGSTNVRYLDTQAYEDACTVYNLVDRGFVKYKPGAASLDDLTKCVGFDMCNDCCKTVMLFHEYKVMFKHASPVSEIVNAASLFMKVPTYHVNVAHGCLWARTALIPYLNSVFEYTRIAREKDKSRYSLDAIKSRIMSQTGRPVVKMNYSTPILNQFMSDARKWTRHYENVNVMFANTINTEKQNDKGHEHKVGGSVKDDSTPRLPDGDPRSSNRRSTPKAASEAPVLTRDMSRIFESVNRQ